MRWCGKSATSDGPLAGYSTKGIENERLSGGVAGVAGCLIVLGLSGGMFWVLRRRSADADNDAEQRTPTTSDV